MTDAARWAVYYAPPAGSALAAFGSAFIGYDAATGRDLPFPDLPGLDAGTIEAATREPRRYGLHATLKPPFRLAPGMDGSDLATVVAGLAGRLLPVEALPLVLRRIAGFWALVPEATSPQLASLAEECVVALDRFRAPPAAAEIARRRAVGLTPRQEALLQRWGYPYVLDEFRFHVTLTGRVGGELSDRIGAALQAALRPLLGASLRVEEIALFRQEEENARFRIAGRWRLGSAG